MSNQIRVQQTPNPNAMKYVLPRRVVEGSGSRSFYNAGQAAADPLAAAVFAVPGVASVFMADDFVTVTKQVEASWEDVTPAVMQALAQT